MVCVCVCACIRSRWFSGTCSVTTSLKPRPLCNMTQTLKMRPPTCETTTSVTAGRKFKYCVCVCVCSCKKNLCKDYMTKVFIDKMCGLYDSVFVYFWSLFAFSFWNSTCLNLHFYERVLDSCYCLQSTWSICCIFLPSQEHKCSKK